MKVDTKIPRRLTMQHMYHSNQILTDVYPPKRCFGMNSNATINKNWNYASFFFLLAANKQLHLTETRGYQKSAFFDKISTGIAVKRTITPTDK